SSRSRFISEYHRKFTQKKLYKLKTEVQELFVSELASRPGSYDNIKYLPGYLHDLGQFDDLISHLDKSHFMKLLEAEQSLNALRTRASLGFSAAKNLERESSQLHFSLLQSVLYSLDFTSSPKLEIEALLELNKIEEAVSQA